jgi:hypothetical protein
MNRLQFERHGETDSLVYLLIMQSNVTSESFVIFEIANRAML